jgi:putative transposase
MKRARFTDEQIVRILQEADRSPVAEVAKRHRVSEPSICAWRKKFGDMGTDDVRRPKALEQENNRLKKTLAERDLEIEVMKEIAVKKW